MAVDDALASPGTLAQIPRVLLGLDRALRFHLRLDPDLLAWGLAWSAAAVALALAAQAFAMRRMLGDPRGRAPWFNGAGVGPYVLGMMAAALGLGAG